ncbi:hypothetical protein LMG33818_002514 [Halomonadaceae bacterium LMG 33818]
MNKAPMGLSGSRCASRLVPLILLGLLREIDIQIFCDLRMLARFIHQWTARNV